MWQELELRRDLCALDGTDESEDWEDADHSWASSGDEDGWDSASTPGSSPPSPGPFQDHGQAQVDTVVGRSGSSTEARTFPWGEECPPWGCQPPCWTCTLDATDRRRWWLMGQAPLSTTRTLSHPSFQGFFAAASSADAPSSLPGLGGHTSTSESQSSTGWSPLPDCSSFYYTDPTMPPGFRIYNRLSGSSQEVCHRLTLNTPAPIMSVREASPPPRSRQLSDQELQVISALLERPAGTPAPAAPAPATPPRCQQ